jgi:hypothetical protein
MLKIFIILALAALFGGMCFFGAVVAPAVFINLPLREAGPFIRTLFPLYYAYIVAFAVLAGVLLLAQREAGRALVSFVVVAVTLWLWFWLIPHLDAFRAMGDMAAFDRGHRFSVYVNGAQLLTVLWLLVRAAV